MPRGDEYCARLVQILDREREVILVGWTSIQSATGAAPTSSP